MNISDWLHATARRAPTSPALLHGEAVVATYARFAGNAGRIAAALAADFGIAPGDRVVLFAGNSVAYLETMYAILWAGAVIVPVNAKLHPDEVAWIAEDAGARLLLTADGRMAKGGGTPEAVTEASLPEFHAYTTGGSGGQLERPVARDHGDLAWLFYTSGTTGRPKGVELTHGNLVAMSTTYALDVDPVDASVVSLYAGPLSHGAGLYSFVHVRAGARHLVPESGGFSADEILSLAGAVGNLSFFAVPTMVRRLVEEAERAGTVNAAGIRTIVYGGGPMYVADIERALDVFGPKFVQIFGQGESPMTITALSREVIADRAAPRWRERLASVGQAQACVDIAVLDGGGLPVAEGEVGEVAVRGPTVMRGYWRNPEASCAALKGGWLRTGDMGFLDGDGFLTLTDRSKDVIISGGSNIYPREVEEVLLHHAAVSEVAVVGKPDPEWGEVVVAFVVPADGGFAPDALDAWCKARIGAFKRPRHYIAVESLPKSGIGKVLKTELRKMLATKDTVLATD